MSKQRLLKRTRDGDEGSEELELVLVGEQVVLERVAAVDPAAQLEQNAVAYLAYLDQVTAGPDWEAPQDPGEYLNRVRQQNDQDARTALRFANASPVGCGHCFLPSCAKTLAGIVSRSVYKGVPLPENVAVCKDCYDYDLRSQERQQAAPAPLRVPISANEKCGSGEDCRSSFLDPVVHQRSPNDPFDTKHYCQACFAFMVERKCCICGVQNVQLRRDSLNRNRYVCQRDACIQQLSDVELPARDRHGWEIFSEDYSKKNNNESNVRLIARAWIALSPAEKRMWKTQGDERWCLWTPAQRSGQYCRVMGCKNKQKYLVGQMPGSLTFLDGTKVCNGHYEQAKPARVERSARLEAESAARSTWTCFNYIRPAVFQKGKRIMQCMTPRGNHGRQDGWCKPIKDLVSQTVFHLCTKCGSSWRNYRFYNLKHVNADDRVDYRLVQSDATAVAEQN